MFTESGLRLHVGMSLTFDIEVVVLQARFTVPLNPLVPTTLIVPVFPVVAPCATVMEVVPPLPGIKPDCAAMVKERLVVVLSVPEVPVIVTVTEVDVTAAEVLAARVSTWVSAAEPAAKDAVTPLGSPLAERLTSPENPPIAVTVIVLVPLTPRTIETFAGETDKVKLGNGFTLMDAVPVAVP